MKSFLADESVDYRLIKALRAEAYEIQTVVEMNSGIKDDEVLEMAINLEAILITEDKDFGELTFRLKKPNKGLILIRMSGVPIEKKINLTCEAIQKHFSELGHSFIIISEHKLRIKHNNVT